MRPLRVDRKHRRAQQQNHHTIPLRLPFSYGPWISSQTAAPHLWHPLKTTISLRWISAWAASTSCCTSRPSSKFIDGHLTASRSWHSAAQALIEHRSVHNNSFLRDFFSDNTVKTILSRPLNPFDQPSPSTKASFETRTAPSQVTRSGNGSYNIDEIKGDTIWLSTKVKVDEITALRIAVLEWQAQPAEKLRSDSAHEVDDTGLANIANFGASAFFPKSSIVAAPLLKDADGFTPEEKRRQRLLKIWIEEKVAVIRIVEILVLAALNRKHNADQTPRTSRGEKSFDESLGDELLTKQESTDDAFLTKCIEAVDTQLGQLSSGSGWYKDEDVVLEVEEAWGKGIMLGNLYVQKLILSHLFFSRRLTHVNPTIQWFKTMDNYGFLAGWQPVSLWHARIDRRLMRSLALRKSTTNTQYYARDGYTHLFGYSPTFQSDRIPPIPT